MVNIVSGIDVKELEVLPDGEWSSFFQVGPQSLEIVGVSDIYSSGAPDDKELIRISYDYTCDVEPLQAPTGTIPAEGVRVFFSVSQYDSVQRPTELKFKTFGYSKGLDGQRRIVVGFVCPTVTYWGGDGATAIRENPTQ